MSVLTADLVGRDPLTESAPPRVWLQVNTEGDAEDRSEPISEANWIDLTWHYESIGGQEVTYVREDIAAAATVPAVAANPVDNRPLAAGESR